MMLHPRTSSLTHPLAVTGYPLVVERILQRRQSGVERRPGCPLTHSQSHPPSASGDRMTTPPARPPRRPRVRKALTGAAGLAVVNSSGSAPRRVRRTCLEQAPGTTTGGRRANVLARVRWRAGWSEPAGVVACPRWPCCHEDDVPTTAVGVRSLLGTTSTDDRDECHVLVVGAGSTGLTLACDLLASGVAVRVVDAAPGPARTSRALGLQPRGVEVLDRAGALGDLEQRSNPMRQVAVQIDGGSPAYLRVGQKTKLVTVPA